MGKRKGFIAVALTLILLGIVILAVTFVNRAEAPTPTPELLISVEAPISGSIISSPVTVRGIVRSGWTAFEGQVGTVTVYDENGAELGVGILAATTDWLRLPVSFGVSVPFQAPTGKTGTLVFESENPSGDPGLTRVYKMPVSF